MTDFMDTLAMDAVKTINSGYYQNTRLMEQQKISLKTAIQSCKTNSVITEIKPASPSMGIIRNSINPYAIAQAMERGGAVGISVLTEPTHFNGSLQTLSQVRRAVKLPLLMKDIVIVLDQIDAASNLGANVILLIQALFDRRCTEMNVDKMISHAHNKGLEVLLETHTESEFKAAIETEADIVGINNRDLANLKIDLSTTCRILEKYKKHDKVVISESGVRTQADIKYLRTCGAQAFLVGSSIMLTDDIELKVKELVNTP